MNLDIPTINSRLVSSIQKREVMWNIIEPGDPYDIRKSMIAKLPGQKSSMGDHLELVCLLQAAEIQRLCQYLDEYKLKFREVERRELDRHSYEVQIKELTMRISDDGNFKAQNLKLREFLRKQSAEFQELKKKLATGGYEAELVRKYEESLRQVQSYMRENQGLKDSLVKLRQEYQQGMNLKSLQIDQLQRRLRDSANASQSARGDAYYKLEIEYKKLQFENKRIREINQAKNREIQELQVKSKQFVYQLEEQTTQIRQFSNVSSTIKEYENRFTLLGQEIQRLNLVLRDKSGELSELTSKYRIIDEEKRRQQDYISQLETRSYKFQEMNRQLEYRLLETSHSQNVLDQSRNVMKNYEGNIEKLSLEIERLNNVLRKKITELEESNRRVSQYEYEIRRSEGVKKQVEDFRMKFSDFNRKMSEYENKIALLSQEIERLNQALKRKTEESSSYEQQLRTRTTDLQQTQKQYYNLQIEYKSQISYITSNYQSKITDLDRENQMNRSKLQDASQVKNYQSEQDRLNLLITNKNAEIERLQSDLLSSRQRDSISGADRQKLLQYETEINYFKQEHEQYRANLDEYEKRIIMLSQEIERLNLVLKNSPSPTRQRSEQQLNIKKLTEYQNKLAILNQEIERLNDNLRAKDVSLRSNEQELDLLRRRQEDQIESTVGELRRKENQAYIEIDRLKEELRIAQQSLNRKNSDHQITTSMNRENQTKIRQLYEENHQFSRKISESEHQITVLSHEIQRLNGVLKLKVEASDNLEQRLRNGTKDADELRKKLAEYENKIALLAQENERIKSSYQLNSQFQIDNYKRKIAEQEKRLAEFQGYVRQNEGKFRNTEQQARTYQLQIRSTYQEVETLKSSLGEASRKYTEYDGKITVLSREIERLNDLLEKFNAQNQDLKRKLYEAEQLKSGFSALEERLARAGQQNEDLRNRLNEGHQSKTKLNQDYQSRIRQLTSEKEQCLRRIQQYETKLTYLAQQMQHVSSVAKDRTDQVSALQNKLRSLSQQKESFNRKMQDLNSANRKIAEYDGKIALLSQQIERLNSILRAKVEQISTLENKCHNYENQLLGYQRKLGDLQNNIARELQTKNNYLSKENEELKLKIRQISAQAGKIPDIENKFALTLGEVQRLNNTLRMKMEEISSQGGKIRSLEQELDRIKRRNEELQGTMHRELKSQSSVFEQRIVQLSQENQGFRRSLRELSDINRRIPELQNKIAILSTEIERLNDLLLKYNKEIVPALEEKNKALSMECEEYRRKCNELIELNKLGQDANGRLRIVTQENDQNMRRIQEYQNRMSQISGEIERLNGVLRGKIEELSNTDAKFRQTQNENEQLNKRLREASELSRRVSQYESKIALLGQEIERLNGMLRSRGEEVTQAQSKLRMFQHEFDTIQRKFGDQESSLVEQKKYRGVLEQKLNSLNNENEEMRRALRQLSDSNRRIAEYESRMALLSQQIQRLNGNLRMKTDQLGASQNMLRNYRKEAESRINSISTQLEQYRRKASENMSSQSSRLAEYEGKMVILSKEIERLNIVLKETTYQLQGSQNKQRQCIQQIERLNNTLRLKVQEAVRWEQANGELKLKLRSYEENLNGCNSEFEKLKYQHNLLAEEYKKSNQHLVEYEQSINKLYQEFERLQSIIQSLKKENYELKVRLQEAGNLVEKNRVLSAEIERLLRIIEQQTMDLEELRLSLADQAALQKRLNEYMALMVVLFAEIESLRKRVKDTEKEIESVRRSSLAPFKV